MGIQRQKCNDWHIIYFCLVFCFILFFCYWKSSTATPQLRMQYNILLDGNTVQSLFKHLQQKRLHHCLKHCVQVLQNSYC